MINKSKNFKSFLFFLSMGSCLHANTFFGKSPYKVNPGQARTSRPEQLFTLPTGLKIQESVQIPLRYPNPEKQDDKQAPASSPAAGDSKDTKDATAENKEPLKGHLQSLFEKSGSKYYELQAGVFNKYLGEDGEKKRKALYEGYKNQLSILAIDSKNIKKAVDGNYSDSEFYKKADKKKDEFNPSCDSLNLYFGGLGFLDKKEMINLGKHLLYDSTVFAFNLSIQQMAPDIKSVLDPLLSAAQTASEKEQKKCDAGQWLAYHGYQLIRSFTGHNDTTKALSTGKASSYVVENDQIAKKTKVPPKNIILDVFKLAHPHSKKLNDEEILLAVNLIGTLVISNEKSLEEKTIQSGFKNLINNISNDVITFDQKGMPASSLSLQDAFPKLQRILHLSHIESKLSEYLDLTKRNLVIPLNLQTHLIFYSKFIRFPLVEYLNLHVKNIEQINLTDLALQIKQGYLKNFVLRSMDVLRHNIALMDTTTSNPEKEMAINIISNFIEKHYKELYPEELKHDYYTNKIQTAKDSQSDFIAKKLFNHYNF